MRTNLTHRILISLLNILKNKELSFTKIILVTHPRARAWRGGVLFPVESNQYVYIYICTCICNTYTCIIVTYINKEKRGHDSG